MTASDNFQKLEQYFHDLEGLDAVRRRARLAELAQSEPDIYPELLRMLADSTALGQGEQLIDELIETAEEITTEALSDPEQIGPYQLQQLIGEGGMGRVYLAEQSEPVRRRVALKLTRRGLDSSEAVARFRAERQALAVLEHPNIARVFDAGSTDGGRPWFAMEYIDGIPITRWAAERKLSLSQRIELLLPVCEAVQHAHAKGLIHRDLKPSNILVVDDGGIGRPMVIDFGIARVADLSLDERTRATRVGELVGTPEYMSPEQASLGEIDIDTRSDIYSLGLVLYELLVGELPMTGAQLRQLGFQAMCQAIREGDTPRPSRAPTPTMDSGTLTWRSRLKGDLDSVLLKALAKDRDQRYGTAAALADDLRRYLANEPVLAQPPSLRYRAGKFVRRNRLSVAAGTIVTVALVAGTLIAGLGLIEARKAAQIAKQERDIAEAATAFMVGLFRAADPRQSLGLELSAREMLERGRERIIDLEEAPAIRARLLETLGEVYWSLGAYPEAEPLLLEGIEIHESALVDEPLRLAAMLDRLGGLRRDQDQLAEAESLHRRALQTLMAAGLDKSLEAGRSYNQLAIVQTRSGQLDEAADSYARALEITQRAIDLDGEKVEARQRLMSLKANLGALHHRRGDFAAARSGLLSALAIAEADLDPQHPYLSTLHNNLARAAARQGAIHAALHHASKALAIDTATLGLDHPNRAITLLMTGQVEQRLGHFDAAQTHLDEALEIIESKLGREHQFFIVVQTELGRLAFAQGQFERAADLFAEIIATRFASENFQASVNELAFHRYRAMSLRAMGHKEDARDVADRALALAESMGDPRGELPMAHLLLAQLAADDDHVDLARQRLQLAHDAANCVLSEPCAALDGSEAYLMRSMVLARMGDIEAALNTLNMAINNVQWNPHVLQRPDLDSLWADSRMQQVAELLNQRVAADRAILAELP